MTNVVSKNSGATQVRLNLATKLGLIILIGTLIMTGIIKKHLSNHRRNAFVTWAKHSAFKIPSLEMNQVEPQFLEQLKELTVGKRFIYLGEPDHFNNEKFAFRLTLIRHLFQLGWRNIAMEIDYSTGQQIDHYLENGDHKYLEFVYGQTPSAEDVACHGKHLEIIKEELRFVEQLRNISELRSADTGRLHYFGYDINFCSPDLAYETVRRLLAKQSSKACVQSLLKSLGKKQDETTEQEISRLNTILKDLITNQEEITNSFGEDTFCELKRSLLTLIDSVHAKTRARLTENPREHYKWMARREGVMFRHITEFISKQAVGERIIVLGHNYHLCKDFTQLRGGPTLSHTWGWCGQAKGFGYSLHALIHRYSLDCQWGCTMGTFLNRMFPEEVVSIWMLYGQGHLMGLKNPIQIRIKNDTIESLLAEVGENFLLPLHQCNKEAHILLEDANFRTTGGYYGSGNLPELTDAIFFVRTVSATQ